MMKGDKSGESGRLVGSFTDDSWGDSGIGDSLGWTSS